MSIKRGEIFWVDLYPVKGSEQAGRRPVLIVQNDIGNEFSPTTIIVPITSTKFLKEYPANVFIPKATAGVKFDSTILLSQIRVIDKSRLASKIGHLPVLYLDKVDKTLKISLGI